MHSNSPPCDVTFTYKSPLGDIVLTSNGIALTGCWFVDQKHLPKLLNTNNLQLYRLIFQETVRWLDLYFDGKVPNFTPPLAPQGSPFRKSVWSILLTIPYGQTMTYGEIATMIAREKGLSMMSAQAVGGAVGHNPIALIIPCHRVIGHNGQLTGYGGGLHRKQWLLDLERKCRNEKHL